MPFSFVTRLQQVGRLPVTTTPSAHHKMRVALFLTILCAHAVLGGCSDIDPDVLQRSWLAMVVQQHQLPQPSSFDCIHRIHMRALRHLLLKHAGLRWSNLLCTIDRSTSTAGQQPLSAGLLPSCRRCTGGARPRCTAPEPAAVCGGAHCCQPQHWPLAAQRDPQCHHPAAG